MRVKTIEIKFPDKDIPSKHQTHRLKVTVEMDAYIGLRPAMFDNPIAGVKHALNQFDSSIREQIPNYSAITEAMDKAFGTDENLNEFLSQMKEKFKKSVEDFEQHYEEEIDGPDLDFGDDLDPKVQAFVNWARDCFERWPDGCVMTDVDPNLQDKVIMSVSKEKGNAMISVIGFNPDGEPFAKSFTAPRFEMFTHWFTTLDKDVPVVFKGADGATMDVFTPTQPPKQ